MTLPIFNIKSFKFGLKLIIKNLKLTKGFTLIELLIVIFIIGILVTMSAVAYTNAQQKGRDSKRKQDLQTIKQALESYYQKNGKYPDTDTSSTGKITCNISPPYAILEWGSPFTCSGLTYLNQLPKDPSGNDYFYCSAAYSGNAAIGACNSTYNIRNYQLNAKLENPNDPDLSNMPCTVNTYPLSQSYNYCITNP